ADECEPRQCASAAGAGTPQRDSATRTDRTQRAQQASPAPHPGVIGLRLVPPVKTDGKPLLAFEQNILFCPHPPSLHGDFTFSRLRRPPQHPSWRRGEKTVNGF